MLSIITTCKGRKHHLVKTVPHNIGLKYPCDFEYIVVDYGDQDRIFDWCKEQQYSQLKSIKVLDDVEFFDPSRARNFGAKIATKGILAFIDGDVFLTQKWIDEVLSSVLLGKYDLAYCDYTEKAGSCLVRSNFYKLLKGYNEQLKNWGYQDLDFYNRCVAKGAKVLKFNHNLIDVIVNTNEERVANYANKQIVGRRPVSNNINSKIAKNTKDVNKNGYALGKYTLYDGTKKTNET